MKIPVALIVSLLFAFLFSGLASGYQQDQTLTFSLNPIQALAAFLTAAIGLAVMVVLPEAGGEARPQTARESDPPRPPRHEPATATANGVRQQGTVKWFNPNKGFGFISAADDSEVFVHYRHIRSEGRRVLRQGQSVTFIRVMGDKGPQAEDVLAD